MLIQHRDKSPTINNSAWIAPNATVCGDVTIGPHSRVMHGAVLSAESGAISIGANCVVMENAVVRANRKHPVTIGDNTLIGPHAHITGATIHESCFVATGASVFNGAVMEPRSQIRINGVLHINSRLPEAAFVPIGWVAVGDPARAIAPGEHDQIWAIQKELDFPMTVWGVERAPEGESLMPTVMPAYCRSLGKHADDVREE